VKTVREVLICSLLAASTALVVSVVRLAQTARTTVASIPGEIESARGDLRREIASTRKELLSRTERQVAELRSGVLAEAAQVRTTADRRIGDTLDRADAAIGKVEEIRGDLRPLLVNAAALSVNVAALTKDAKNSWDDLYWDVKASVASATVAANSIGQMSADFHSSLPRTLQTWDGIGGNVAAVTGNIDRLTKPHWYDRLLGYGLNGIVMYRNLNPVTNLTVKGAQALSVRP
jgi:hypothetical protein